MPEPVVIATWAFGRTAVEVAAAQLRQGKPALDAALAGAQAVEDDPLVDSVGFGGLPNRLGVVQLDACVMDGRTLACGAVAGLENVRHAAALARRVMEQTPHILLVGEGARWFAVQQGFPLETLTTPESLAEWQKRSPGARPTPEKSGGAAAPCNHDTLTVLALDTRGDLGGVCTTSGLAHKLPGRVGDSPIIGAGLYVDNEAGAAGGTGVGEEILRIGGSLTVVEALRNGQAPQEACALAARRVHAAAVRRGVPPAPVAFLALDPRGRVGAAATKQTRFQYAIARGDQQVELATAPEIGVEDT